MRALIALAALVLFLAACAPALAPSLERQNGDVLVTVTANRAVYDVTITVLDAVTADERCVQVDSDLWCPIGDLDRGDTATILVAGEFGVTCTAAGYIQSDKSLTSYRPWACRVVPAVP